MLDAIRENTLDNGLKIISCKKTDTPVISIQIWYKTGSRNESKGIFGISHFLEHMMFRGSKNVGSEEHARRINDIGGHCNAFTSEDITSYTNSVPKEHLTMVLELEADRMQQLVFNQNLIETERKVIIEEYYTYMNNPLAQAFLEFRNIFFYNHPYQVSPLGKLVDIQAITAQDLEQYHHDYYSPDNATIVVVGDFNQTETLVDQISNYFSQIKTRISSKENQNTSFTLENKSNWMMRKVDFDVPIVLTGYPAPSSSSDDVLAMEIAQMIISQGETSRLHKELVRNQSIAVVAGGINHSLKYAGLSLFFASFTPDTSHKKVAAALNTQIEQIRNSGINIQELNKAKNMTLTNRTFELYSAEHICYRLGYSEIVDGNYRTWVKKLEDLQKLELSTLGDIIQKYWKDEYRHSLFLKPKKVNPLLFGFGLFRRLFSKAQYF